jgi:hypothetical protein
MRLLHPFLLLPMRMAVATNQKKMQVPAKEKPVAINPNRWQPVFLS